MKLIRRLLLILTVGSIAALIVLNLDPVTTKLHRLAILCALGGIWLGPLLLFWKSKPLRYILLPIPLIAAVPFLLPGKPIAPGELRAIHLSRLTSYENSPYHWGGEKSRGIDCSGLPRKAMRDALLTYGIRNTNGKAFRSFISYWWNDASAKALGESHLDFTIPTYHNGTIATMDYGNLLPGDLAVTEDQRHILAYLGNEQWIQADPGAGKVIIENGRTSSNGWFAVPITTHRWTLLEHP